MSECCSRIVPVRTCMCCLGMRCGRPCGCCADLSFGGPFMMLPFLSLKGFPLATLHVSHGGDSIAACTLPLLIWTCQKWIVVTSDRSLCGDCSLERSIEMVRMSKCSW